jgi:hypothetical protein
VTQLRRRVPVVRRMKLLRYDVSKDADRDGITLRLNRSQGRYVGVSLRRGRRCWYWIWRTVA